MDNLSLFYQYLWIFTLQFVACTDFTSTCCTLLLNLILSTGAFCALPLSSEGTNEILIFPIGIICMSTHSTIFLKTCSSPHLLILDFFPPMTCFLFILWDYRHFLCGSLLFVGLPERQWTPWEISTKFDKFHSTQRDVSSHYIPTRGTEQPKRDLINTSVQQRLLLELNSLGIRESNHKFILGTTMQKWATLVLLFKTLLAPLLPWE